MSKDFNNVLLNRLNLLQRNRHLYPIAIIDDARWPATEGAPNDVTTQLIHHHLDAVIALATKDPKFDLFARVVHLIEPK